MSVPEELAIIAKKLEKHIVMLHEPVSTWWNRNHTEVAEWYFIWNFRRMEQERKMKKIANSVILSSKTIHSAKDFTKNFNKKVQNEQ